MHLFYIMFNKEVVLTFYIYRCFVEDTLFRQGHMKRKQVICEK
jgi:hypothetical protein